MPPSLQHTVNHPPTHRQPPSYTHNKLLPHSLSLTTTHTLRDNESCHTNVPGHPQSSHLGNESTHTPPTTHRNGYNTLYNGSCHTYVLEHP